uniref:nuclear RNA export factor 2-like n=1 Tax=Ictidomys tridecemlineatus TaxID=43179 RepID=UPI001A9FE440|nr:nuclear RNA export factor 2-like [Ictidomys tridecemlineatus]
MCSTLKKYGTYRNEVSEYRDKCSALQGRKRCGSLSWSNSGRRKLHYEHTGTPYSAHRDHRRGKWHDEEPTHVTLWREKKTRGREMGKEIRDGVKRRWFKVTIPYGRKYDKAWLMNSIQGHCSVPFTPVDFHYIRNRARFFVQDAGTASALKDVSYKICDDNDVKILVLVSPSAVPYSVQNKFSAEQVEQLKLTMRKRYDVSQQALDLQKLRFDPAALLTSSSLLKDGQELPTPIVVDLEAPKLIKPCTEDSKGTETLKNLVLQFLQEYYLIYDHGDREGLLSAYHNKACFSLTIPFHPKDSAQNSLCRFAKDSKNMRKLRNSYQWKQLKHTKRDILDTLCVLPKTRHDLSSFVVDMWFQTETMLCFSVNGLFKEVEGKSQGCVHAFTRTFVATPGSNSSLCIVNDQLLVRDASPGEIQSAFSIPMPTHCSSFMPSLSQEQQETVQAFSIQSGMKLEWSQK